MDFSYQEPGNQKDDFDFFRYYNWQTYTHLGRLIRVWQPKKESYNNLHEACQEFLSYYRTKTNQNFPDEYLFRMEEFVGLKLDLLN